MTEAAYIEMKDNDHGVCLSCCSEHVSGVAADARNEMCCFCGCRTLFGMEELLKDGQIQIISARDNDLLPRINGKVLIARHAEAILGDGNVLGELRAIYDNSAERDKSQTEKDVERLREEWRQKAEAKPTRKEQED